MLVIIVTKLIVKLHRTLLRAANLFRRATLGRWRRRKCSAQLSSVCENNRRSQGQRSLSRIIVKPPKNGFGAARCGKMSRQRDVGCMAARVSCGRAEETRGGFRAEFSRYAACMTVGSEVAGLPRPCYPGEARGQRHVAGRREETGTTRRCSTCGARDTAGTQLQNRSRSVQT